jgi:hypothetical protein
MAVEYVGNIIPAPGFYKGNTSYDPELLYSTARFTQKGVTLAPGQGILPLGQAMAQRTADKLWVKYNDGGSGGANVCRGILRRGVDTGADSSSDARVYQGNVVISGILKLELVVGSDAAALVDLNARTDSVFGTYTF